MRNISDSKISNYGRNKRVFLDNPRYKSVGRVKTKPTFNQLIKDTHNQLIEKWGTYMEVNDPSLYESMTGKKARKPVIEVDSKEEVKKIDTSYDDLYAYQKKREAEREAQLEKEREKLKKKEIKFNFTAPKKDWSIYGGWVNAFEPIKRANYAALKNGG
jgi:hypothetical protein